ALQGHHALVDELGRHHERVVRPRQAWIVDVDPLEAPADHRRLETLANGLDLGQLRHPRSLAPGGRPDSVRVAAADAAAELQPARTSITSGLAGGCASASRYAAWASATAVSADRSSRA